MHRRSREQSGQRRTQNTESNPAQRRRPAIGSERAGREPRTSNSSPYLDYEIADEDLLLALDREPSSPGFEITGERTIQPDPPRRSNVAERIPTPYQPEEQHPPRDQSQPPPLPTTYGTLPQGLRRWIDRAARIHPAALTLGARGFRFGQPVWADEYHSADNAQNNTPNHMTNLPRIPDLDFVRPRLDYEAQGFEFLGVTRATPPAPPTSPYQAPRAAIEGYARKVDEEDVVVCPNCGDELGTGLDDVKQQIWAVKQCGHVS